MGKGTRRPQAAKSPGVKQESGAPSCGPGQSLLPLQGNLPSRALQGAETSTGGRMAPLRREEGSFRSGRLIAALQSGWQPAPSSASHSLGTFPPRGRLSGDRKGRPYGGYGSSSIFLVGAGPRPARQDSYRERWLGKLRRRYWTTPAAIFAPPGPSGPVGIQTDHSDFARRKRCTAYQEAVPRNGVRGKRPMGLGGA